MSSEHPKRGLGRRLLRAVLLVVAPLAAAAAGLYLYIAGGRYVVTENAYVKANLVAVSANVSGRVVWVGARDNAVVEAGEALFQIDPARFEIALVGAEARMAVVRTEIESLRSDHREAEALLAEAEERVRFLELQYERQEQLQKKGVGSQERYDAAHHELTMARQRIRTIKRQIENVVASLGGKPDLPVARHPRYLEARAARDRAELELGDTVVAAPVGGTLSNVSLEAGEFVRAGAPVFSLIEGEPLWVEANLKETQLTHVRTGQRATFIVDAYPDVVWRAEVESISPATGAEFALLPPQNATGNWVKVVQRLPVRLRIVTHAGAPELRAGMTVTARIDTERERDLGGVVREALAWGKRWP